MTRVTCPACHGSELVPVDYDPYTNGWTENDCTWCEDGLVTHETAEKYEAHVEDLPRRRWR